MRERPKIQTIIQNNQAIHGEYSEQSAIYSALKDAANHTGQYGKLTPIHKEALDMIFIKISRIMAGNHNHHDHWDDIAGYATLVSQHIPLKSASPNDEELLKRMEADMGPAVAANGTETSSGR